MVLFDYYKGGTRIIIKDDLCCDEHEEIKRLKRVEEIATKALYSKTQRDKTA